MTLAARVELLEGAKVLLEHAREIRVRLPGEPALWPEYLSTLLAFTAVQRAAAPEAGALLTTGQMAERLSMTPKTLLRHVAGGKIKPTIERGKLKRWSGRETL